MCILDTKMNSFYFYAISSPYIDTYGYQKLGISIDPVHRMYTYNTGDPPGIRLEKRYNKLWRVKATNTKELRQIEQTIHTHFQEKRLIRENGSLTEWFELSIDELCKFMQKQDFVIEELSLDEIEVIHQKSKVSSNDTKTSEQKEEDVLMDEDKEQLQNLNHILELQQQFKRVFLPNFQYRRIQLELWSNLLKLFKTDTLSYKGIVQWPTGVGKTIGMLIIVVLMKEWCAKQRKYYRGLLISPKNDIFNTIAKHFKGLEKFGIQLLDGSNANFSKLSVPKDKHFLIFACHQAVVDEKQMRRLPPLNHIHYDEVHRIGGQTLFTLLNTLIQEWRVNLLTGTSATPLTSSEEQRKKIGELFGNPINILHKCDIDEAVHEGWIARPQFHVKLLPKVKRDKLLELFAQAAVDSIHSKGKFGKHILYVKDSKEDVKSVYDCLRLLYPDVKSYHAIDDSTRNDSEFLKVDTSTQHALLCACQRYLEGSDIQGLESTGILIGDTISAHTLLQIIGRALRLDYPEKIGTCLIVKAVDENTTEEEVLDSIVFDIMEIVGLPVTELIKKEYTRKIVETYFGTVEIRGKTISVEETVDRVQAAYIRREYTRKTPKEKYQDIQTMNRELGLKSKTEYEESKVVHPRYIENPDKYFKDIWASWYHFLGVDTSKFPQTKTEWIRLCKERGITSWEEYKAKSMEDMPINPGSMYEDYQNWDKEFEVVEELVW